MNLIEQAAKRLEELRRAGAEIANDTKSPAEPHADGTHAPQRVPTPEAVVREVAARNLGGATKAFRGAQSDATDVALSGRSATTPPVPVSALGNQRASDAARVHAVSPTADGRTRHPRLEINLDRLKSRGFVTPDAPRSQIADEFRVIKRPILRNAIGGSGKSVRNGNLIMVTSSLPGEGKTFTAVNLAMSVAMELGTTVLLVDGDVAHPEFPQLLGAPKSPGLLELLTQEDLDVDDVLLRTNVENLSVLPAGSHHRRATELLASEQMAILLRKLATQYPDRIIIFDSPPLLATTEARVLATHMGQIVMVVAADSTRQRAVNLALATIESCDIVLMMLNKADETDVGAYYGYYADEQSG